MNFYAHAMLIVDSIQFFFMVYQHLWVCGNSLVCLIIDVGAKIARNNILYGYEA